MTGLRLAARGLHDRRARLPRPEASQAGGHRDRELRVRRRGDERRLLARCAPCCAAASRREVRPLRVTRPSRLGLRGLHRQQHGRRLPESLERVVAAARRATTSSSPPISGRGNRQARHGPFAGPAAAAAWRPAPARAGGTSRASRVRSPPIEGCSVEVVRLRRRPARLVHRWRRRGWWGRRGGGGEGAAGTAARAAGVAGAEAGARRGFGLGIRRGLGLGLHPAEAARRPCLKATVSGPLVEQ